MLLIPARRRRAYREICFSITDMNTDTRELSDREIYERECLDDDFERKYGMKMIANTNGNGTFAGLKNTVFVAVILGMGVIVWDQQATNANFAREIAVLKLECKNNTRERGFDER